MKWRRKLTGYLLYRWKYIRGKIYRQKERTEKEKEFSESNHVFNVKSQKYDIINDYDEYIQNN